MKSNYFRQALGRQNYVTVLIEISNIYHDSHRIYECYRVSENIHLWPQVAAREADMFGNWGVI